ncbi:MAG: ABC transporter substrate-binding protein [Treponema sp.]|jgi:raffinose/stachyose/melibiose transport system substrate-binding protein|nr:ABC transporter substrate-binding protein [Treponema sp.]
MKNLGKVRIIGLCAMLCAGMIMVAGCSKPGTTGGGADKGYDLYIFNSKGENAAQFEAMAKAFQAETGVRVKVFSIGSGAEQIGPLTTEMNSKNMPVIYSIQGIKELNMWLDGGYVTDLSTVDHPAFAKLVADITPSFRMTLGGSESYGIPYNIEGYGYIADRLMIADIFGQENTDAVILSIKTATYAEWEALVKALDAWIKSPSAATVTLSGKPYTLAAAKTGRAENLTGVFTFAGALRWTYGDHFINVAMNAVLSSPEATLMATADQIRQLKGPFIAYAKALDLKSTYMAGKNGPAHRGQDLVSPANYGYDQVVQLFAEGKGIFLKQGNWAYNNIANVNQEMAERLTFLPIKMPFTQGDITVPGLTVEKMARSIPVFVPNYYAVNALSSAAEKKAAYDFLVWMNTSPSGQHFIVDEMAFIPYNADPATTTVPNSLGNSIIDYMNAGDMLNGSWLGCPPPWAQDTVGQLIMEQYLTKLVWTEADYTDIADYAVEQLIKLKQ